MLTRDVVFRLLDLMVEAGAEGTHVFGDVADDGGLLYEVWVDEWEKSRARMINVVTTRTQTTFEIEMHNIRAPILAMDVLNVRASIITAFYSRLHEVNGDHAIGTRVMRMLWG